MTSFIFHAQDATDTDRFAKQLASLLPTRLVIGLTGTLGAGKTYLVRQVCRELAIGPHTVLSPTFTICNEYHGIRTVYHFDLYRIPDEDAFYELGASEYFEADAICFLEWADRFPACLPADRLMIDLDAISESQRIITVTAMGFASKRLIEGLAQD